MTDDINIWSWDKVPPHLHKNIYAGRIFCFEFDENTYCFGRIMTKTLVGFIAEIFDHTSSLPEIDADNIKNAKRLSVQILDTKYLFELNKEHNWRIIGDQRNYVPENVDNIAYRLGAENKKVDFFGKITEINSEEADALPLFVPLRNEDIKRVTAPLIGKEYIPGKPEKKKPDFEIWGWDKKPRTLLRYIDAGQIFCFKLEDNKFCFGRIMTYNNIGHIAEFFDYCSDTPDITKEIIESSKRVAVEIISSYTLFDRKSEGEWRIIGNCGNYIPTDVENIIYFYGLGSGTRITDFFGHETFVSIQEAKKYPPLFSKGDYQIKADIINKLKI